MSRMDIRSQQSSVIEYFHDMVKTLEGETKKHGLKDVNYFLSLARKTLEEKEKENSEFCKEELENEG